MMEPWQMTENEYRRLMYVGLPTKEKQADIRETHKYLVQLALSEGKPVPPEVLADYPDLVLKESEFTQKRVNPIGTCYPDSWRYVMRHPEGVLVHGTIVGLRGRMNHAWVELPDGTVWDPSAQAPMPTEKYYSLVDPIVEDRYTADEAAMMLNVGKHGPWTEEERQRILGGNPMPRDYEGEPKWGVMVKRFEGKDYKYYMTEPTDKDIKKMRQKGYRVRVTTRDAVREMWVRMPLESEEGNPIILEGGNPTPRTEAETSGVYKVDDIEVTIKYIRPGVHEISFLAPEKLSEETVDKIEELIKEKTGVAESKTIKSMLPTPPESGPPLPRALGLRWPWK